MILKRDFPDSSATFPRLFAGRRASLSVSRVLYTLHTSVSSCARRSYCLTFRERFASFSVSPVRVGARGKRLGLRESDMEEEPAGGEGPGELPQAVLPTSKIRKVLKVKQRIVDCNFVNLR